MKTREGLTELHATRSGCHSAETWAVPVDLAVWQNQTGSLCVRQHHRTRFVMVFLRSKEDLVFAECFTVRHRCLILCVCVNDFWYVIVLFWAAPNHSNTCRSMQSEQPTHYSHESSMECFETDVSALVRHAISRNYVQVHAKLIDAVSHRISANQHECDRQFRQTLSATIVRWNPSRTPAAMNLVRLPIFWQNKNKNRMTTSFFLSVFSLCRMKTIANANSIT